MTQAQADVRTPAQLVAEIEARRLRAAERDRRYRERRRAGLPPVAGWGRDVLDVLATDAGQHEFLRAVGAA